MRRTFTLLRTLGRGAHGSVHLAEMRDEEDGYVQTLAVKRLLPEWTHDRDLVSRLRAEFKLLALLSHEHIVRVHGLTQLDGGLAILMEPVEGVDLGRIIARNGALEPRVVLEIVSAVADALDAAWCTVPPGQDEPLTVVHRDIKPSNVMLTPRGGVKVMDFGVARATFDSREVETRSQQFGTARYMAPERWLDGHADHRSDVFSLGVTAIEIATGAAVPRFRLSRDGFAEDSRLALDGIAWEPLRSLVARLIAFEVEDRPSAAETASAALALLPDAPGPPLRVWANGHVTVDTSEPTEATATVTVVREDTVNPSQRSLTGTAPAPVEPPRGRRWGVPAAIGAAAAVALAIVVALGQRDPPPIEVPPPTPVTVAPMFRLPPEPTVPVPAPEPLPEPLSPPEPVPAPDPVVRPTPAPVPTPPPAPEPVALARVTLIVDEGLVVRVGDERIVGRRAVSLPATRTVELVVEESGRRWPCRIAVPPSYGEVRVHPQSSGGCEQ